MELQAKVEAYAMRWRMKFNRKIHYNIGDSSEKEGNAQGVARVATWREYSHALVYTGLGNIL